MSLAGRAILGDAIYGVPKQSIFRRILRLFTGR
jgi:hypothetical protein